MQYIPCFTQLKELQLFRNSVLREVPGLAEISGVASFVNGVGPHLEVLKIEPNCFIDFSNLFARLCPMPRLTRLAVSLLLPLREVQNTSGVIQFLSNAFRTVETLELTIVPDISFLDFGSDEVLAEFLATCTANNKAPTQLRSLNLFMTPFDIDVGLLLQFVQCAASSLEHLAITPQYFNEHGTTRLFDVLASCPKLSYLHINTSLSTTPPHILFSKLMAAVPGLQVLLLSQYPKRLRIYPQTDMLVSALFDL